MTNIGLNELLSILRYSDTSTSLEQLAERRGLTLSAEDREALRGLEQTLRVGKGQNPEFAMSLLSHPQVPIPRRSGGGGDPPTHSQAAVAKKIDFVPDALSHPQLAIPQRKIRPVVSQTSQQQPVSTSTLPPWGQMDETLDTDPDFVPFDWDVPDQFPIWLNRMVADLSFLLWPTYDPGNPAGWPGPGVGALLDADFRLLADLHPNLQFPIPSTHPTEIFHERFFTEEDDKNIAWGTGYERYDPSLSAQVLKDLPDILAGGMADKVADIHLQLKQRFQRPRAYQVAWLQQRQGFKYRWGRTSFSPSLVSGHCLQACIAGCTAFVSLISGLSQKSVTSLAQFTVDIGDRRIYAGVHYPSDNLASWYVALSMIPHIFDTEEAAWFPGEFLWKAIKNRSDVYRSIVAYDAQQNGKSAYTKMLVALQELGKTFENPADPPDSIPAAR